MDSKNSKGKYCTISFCLIFSCRKSGTLTCYRAVGCRHLGSFLEQLVHYVTAASSRPCPPQPSCRAASPSRCPLRPPPPPCSRSCPLAATVAATWPPVWAAPLWQPAMRSLGCCAWPSSARPGRGAARSRWSGVVGDRRRRPAQPGTAGGPAGPPAQWPPHTSLQIIHFYDINVAEPEPIFCWSKPKTGAVFLRRLRLRLLGKQIRKALCLY